MNKNHLIVKIRSYSSLVILENLRFNNIVVYNFKKSGDYDFVFEVDMFNERKIKKLYPDCVILKRQGLLGRIRNSLVNKITIIALLISLLFFFDLNSRISNVKIIGTNTRLNELIYERSQELGLKKYARIPKYQVLVDIENVLKKEYVNDIDFVEVRQNGTIVSIRYQTRKDSVDIPSTNNSLYAKKNGIISHYVLTSGIKMVEEGQYVTQGTILVSDTIIDTSGNSIYVGAYGQVYARTWTIIELNGQATNDKAETFLIAMQSAKDTMCKGFALEEKILEENVLKYECTTNKYYLKIHFTCLENIGI
ncbi:MAG: sporulation protein YqfD [Erysipelotrichales bacterium]|nr:sporulation protein YqfD [Erysipelotrichales bacterium]